MLLFLTISSTIFVILKISDHFVLKIIFSINCFILITLLLILCYSKYISHKGDVRMAKKKTVKIDPKKIKKEDLQNVFSNVLSKLKSK